MREDEPAPTMPNSTRLSEALRWSQRSLSAPLLLSRSHHAVPCLSAVRAPWLAELTSQNFYLPLGTTLLFLSSFGASWSPSVEMPPTRTEPRSQERCLTVQPDWSAMEAERGLDPIPPREYRLWNQPTQAGSSAPLRHPLGSTLLCHGQDFVATSITEPVIQSSRHPSPWQPCLWMRPSHGYHFAIKNTVQTIIELRGPQGTATARATRRDGTADTHARGKEMTSRTSRGRGSAALTGDSICSRRTRAQRQRSPRRSRTCPCW
ncbi:hypothetical protein H920_00125 [Fukomys damarensis]|uniref:Uncharacterized protein n=1 Tax=Fukomys damarensis TaxID=885580 RepID=A0A091ERR4_FUKDA|nr:hypothetical protein H920_00125 [Fukomys damarensis]